MKAKAKKKVGKGQSFNDIPDELTQTPQGPPGMPPRPASKTFYDPDSGTYSGGATNTLPSPDRDQWAKEDAAARTTSTVPLPRNAPRTGAWTGGKSLRGVGGGQKSFYGAGQGPMMPPPMTDPEMAPMPNMMPPMPPMPPAPDPRRKKPLKKKPIAKKATAKGTPSNKKTPPKSAPGKKAPMRKAQR